MDQHIPCSSDLNSRLVFKAGWRLQTIRCVLSALPEQRHCCDNTYYPTGGQVSSGRHLGMCPFCKGVWLDGLCVLHPTKSLSPAFPSRILHCSKITNVTPLICMWF